MSTENTQLLHQELDTLLKYSGSDFFIKQVPDFVYSNLKEGYGKREYQQQAFGRFVYYFENYKNKPAPTHVLYHMATGSGKTLIMAGLMIYLYEKGYRNFLFFVNSKNIIEKTRDNFLNTASLKYLFSGTVSIGDKQIRIKEVDNFQSANQEDINIVFSTIQLLHLRLNTPKENSVTYDDFEDQKMVLISDEAHHISAETKKGGGGLGLDEPASWEGTAAKIFNANSGNILLEFTATIDLSVPEIQAKYRDIIIYDYPLWKFREDGYSKEIKVLQADLKPFERALQGVLISQYRKKIFEKYKKLIKPIILFKSKTISESKSFFKEFAARIKNLKVSDLQKIQNAHSLDTALGKVFQYLEENNISFENFIFELKGDFSEEKLISVNSTKESEQKQLAVNSLEDEHNEYRAVFAVAMLNEGWDVLNLFDIVRLYETRNAGKDGKPSKTTMAEAQLIGRGARYCPFQITEDQPLFCRKYDYDIANELRICEELFYHSAHNPKYIYELTQALKELGIIPKKTIERHLQLKKEFKETRFYQDGVIFLNKQQQIVDRKAVVSLPEILRTQTYKITLKTGCTKSSIIFDDIQPAAIESQEEEYKLAEFGQHIIRKALNKLEFYQFSNLKKRLPNLDSVSEFITSPKYLGKIKLNVAGLPEQINNLTPKEKLDASVQVLQNISIGIPPDEIKFKGSKEFKRHLLKHTIRDKVLNFADEGSKEFGQSMINPEETEHYLDLSKRDWYVFNDCFGTSEEKLFIKYIDGVYEKLHRKYDKIFLVRNERYFKIFTFDEGKAIEPDFVLFLVSRSSEEAMHYQIFIEPKGEHLLETDRWKEEFLESLKEKHNLEPLWESQKYAVWGMPFYNSGDEKQKKAFEAKFNKFIE